MQVAISMVKKQCSLDVGEEVERTEEMSKGKKKNAPVVACCVGVPS